MSVYPQGPEEDIGSLGFRGAGVTGSCELIMCGLGLELGPSGIAIITLKLWGHVSIPHLAVRGRISPRVTLGLTGMASKSQGPSHLPMLSSTSTSTDHNVCFSLFCSASVLFLLLF